ncbi:MAG: ATP-binding protein [Oscillospiraceae bacterium]|nr:ATP-binding protein [Oscillospiraceae bacterium]
MTELSLNILDVAQNSIKAEAKLVELFVLIDTAKDILTIEINDDGCGMPADILEKVADPFFTTRDTRNVGLGVPFFKEAAESTGGSFSITSETGKGTRVKATFTLSHIDRMPLGDINSTVETLVFYNTHLDFHYKYHLDGEEFSLDTREIKELLEGQPIDAPEVKEFISGYLAENSNEINKTQTF